MCNWLTKYSLCNPPLLATEGGNSWALEIKWLLNAGSIPKLAMRNCVFGKESLRFFQLDPISLLVAFVAIVAHIYPSITGQRQALIIERSTHFHCNDYFVAGEICHSLEVSNDPMFLWISSNSCSLNLLLVRSHQAEMIVIKRLIQGRNNVTRVRVEPTLFDQDHRKNLQTQPPKRMLNVNVVWRA